MNMFRKGHNLIILIFFIASFLLSTTDISYSLSIESEKSLHLRIPFSEITRQKDLQRELFLAKWGLSKDTRKPLKVLLIQPRLSTQKSKPTRLPAGLMSLASALKDKGFIAEFCKRLCKEKFIFEDYESYPDFVVEILDLQAESEDFDLEAYLKESNPDAVGFTGTTPAMDDVLSVSALVEKTIPQAIRIIGGPHVSALPKETLEKSNFQIVVKGEGIEALTELLMELRLDNPDLSQIEGLYYKDEGGEIVETGLRSKIMHLEEYPFPALSVDLLNIDGYEEMVDVDGVNQGQGAVLFTSTGCPYGKCIFCASKAVFNRKVDFRSAENVFEEIKYLYDKGFRAFYILDDLFTLSKKRILKLAELIEEFGIEIQYSMMTRANFIDEEVADALKRTGCKVTSLGVESGDQDLLNEVIDKGIELDRTEKTTELLKSKGIHVKYFMMVGLPNQGWESIRKSAYFVLKNRPDSMNVSTAMPYPGSNLYTDDRINVVSNGERYVIWQHEAEPQLKQNAPTEAVTETNVMSREEIAKARDLMMAIFKNRHDAEKTSLLFKELDILTTKKPEEALDGIEAFFVLSNDIESNRLVPVDSVLDGLSEAGLRTLYERLVEYEQNSPKVLYRVRAAAYAYAVSQLRGEEEDSHVVYERIFTHIRNLTKEIMDFDPHFQQIGTGKGNLQIPDYLQDGKWLVLESPARVEIESQAGSDLLAISTIKPELSQVLNISVNIEGLQPVRVAIRRTEKPMIRLQSEDLGLREDIRSLEQLFGALSEPGKDLLSLLKAAIVVSGIVPLDLIQEKKYSLEEHLAKLGGGFEMVTEVRNVPQHSGLGISSILSGTMVLGLRKFSGQAPSLENITKQEIEEAVGLGIFIEQVIGIGGGYQDFFGLSPGLKEIQAQHAEEGMLREIAPGSIVPQLRLLKLEPDVIYRLKAGMVLWDQGAHIPVTGSLQAIVMSFLLGRDQGLRKEWQSIYHDTREALIGGDLEKVGRLQSRSFELRGALCGSSWPESVHIYTRRIEEELRKHFGVDYYGSDNSGGRPGAARIAFINPARRAEFERVALEISRNIQQEILDKANEQGWTDVNFEEPKIYHFDINVLGATVSLSDTLGLDRQFSSFSLDKRLQRKLDSSL